MGGGGGERQIDTDRQTDRDKDRDTQTETDRQTDSRKERDKSGGKQTVSQTDRQHRQRHRQQTEPCYFISIFKFTVRGKVTRRYPQPQLLKRAGSRVEGSNPYAESP